MAPSRLDPAQPRSSFRVSQTHTQVASPARLPWSAVSGAEAHAACVIFSVDGYPADLGGAEGAVCCRQVSALCDAMRCDPDAMRS
eukprot:702247-Rhodomonas_salina.1